MSIQEIELYQNYDFTSLKVRLKATKINHAEVGTIAGVSRSTAGHILNNNLKPFAPITIKAVKEAAEQLLNSPEQEEETIKNLVVV